MYWIFTSHRNNTKWNKTLSYSYIKLNYFNGSTAFSHSLNIAFSPELLVSEPLHLDAYYIDVSYGLLLWTVCLLQWIEYFMVGFGNLIKFQSNLLLGLPVYTVLMWLFPPASYHKNKSESHVFYFLNHKNRKLNFSECYKKMLVRLVNYCYEIELVG